MRGTAAWSAAAPQRELDRLHQPVIPAQSDDAPERHRRRLDRSPLVARIDLCGAMARLIG
jgi:hypothetical protein